MADPWSVRRNRRQELKQRAIVRGISDVAPEAVLLAGAGRAILLQLANPGVGYGVARHSDFVAAPLRRLHGTLRYIYAVTNGTPQQQDRVRRDVHRAHRPVQAAAGAGSPAYTAHDPALQLWVAATLYDSALQSYTAVFGALPEEAAEAVYRDYRVLGTSLGMPAALWPATRVAFARYWDAQVSLLRVDATIAGVAEELLAARHAPWWLRALMPLARFLTVGLLPPTVRTLYGFSWSARQDRRLAGVFRLTRGLVRVLPRRLRHAPMHYYLRRLH